MRPMAINVEKPIGMTKRYAQLTTAIAAKHSANVHLMPRVRASVSGPRPPSCHANTA